MKAHLKDPNKTAIKISACMIAKNEAGNIGRCIDSVKDFADEIVVVDTGSTDNTVEIAKEHGAEVGYFEWCNDFAAAKNAALDLVSGDWIIFLDADEYFNQGSGDKIIETIKIAESDHKNAIGCRMVNLDTKSGNEIAEGFSVRIFKKGIRYQYAVHEEIFRPEGLSICAVDKKWFYLNHTGYSALLMPTKAKRNLEIMLREIDREQSPIRKCSYYNYISDAYFSLRQYEESIKYGKKYIEKSGEHHFELVGCQMNSYLNIIKSLETTDGDQGEMEYWIDKMERVNPNYPDAAFSRARLFMKQRRYRAALGEYQRALKLNENYNGTDHNYVSASMAEIYHSCGSCQEALLNIPDAISSYFRAFEIKNDAIQSVFCMISLLKQMPQSDLNKFIESLYRNADLPQHMRIMAALMANYMYDQLLQCYASYKSKTASETIDGQVTAFLLASRGEFDKAAVLFIQVYNTIKDAASAIRGLLCAFLSNSNELINNIMDIAPKGALEALGLAKRSFSFDAVEEYADLYTELSRMGHSQRVLNLISELGDADELFLLKLAEALESRYCFEGALQAIRLCPLTGKALMLGGYYAYRLGMYSYARDCFDAARYEDYSAPGLADLERELNDRVSSTINRNQDLNQLIQNISSAIESDPAKALELIRQYKLLDADNSEINSAECVINYQMGLYHDAAVNVLGALHRCGAVFDLHYNAYCIFDKMGDTSRAVSHLKQAIELCSDEETRAELMEELSALNRQDLQK